MSAALKKPVLQLRNVGVYYGRSGLLRNKNGRWIFKDISLDLQHGESLGVIGRNGIGKSTLLRTMAGIIAPDAGTVQLQRNKKAALLSLRTGFSPMLSGRDNILLSGMLQGMDYKEMQERMQHIIAFSGVGEQIDAPLDTYSDGMKARLGFAISTQIKTDVLLLDEVLGVGDASFRKKSASVMKERIRSDQTVVLVSHNPDTIRELCTRAIWIEDGKIAAEGDVGHVLEAYIKGEIAK